LNQKLTSVPDGEILKPVCRHRQKYPEVASPWLPNQFGHAASMLGKDLTEKCRLSSLQFLVTNCGCLESELNNISAVIVFILCIR
jgi:hypothetical protein